MTELIAFLALAFIASSVGVFTGRRIRRPVVAYPLAALLSSGTFACLYWGLNELYVRGFFPDKAPATNFVGAD